MTSPGRTRLLVGCALSVGVVLACLVLELTARLVFHRGVDFDMEMWKYATQVKIASSDPTVGHIHAPHRQAYLMGVNVTTNSFGLRGGETTAQKRDDTYRIVVIGDSVTMGWGVPQDQTYPAQLERLLNRQPLEGIPAGTRYEVLNLGVGNYNTTQEVALLEKVGLQFDPDLILVGYFINDAEPTVPVRQGLLISRSYAYAFLLSRLRALPIGDTRVPAYAEYYGGLYAEDRPGWLATQRAVARLGALSREHDVPVAVAIIPELHDLSRTGYPFTRVHRMVADLARRNGLPTMDLFPEFAGYAPEQDLWVTPADAHPNAKGQALIARGIHAGLKDIGARRHAGTLASRLLE